VPFGLRHLVQKARLRTESWWCITSTRTGIEAMFRLGLVAFTGITVSLFFLSWKGQHQAASSSDLTFPASVADIQVPLGLPDLYWPEDNPYTPQKAELGRLLYYDTRLSANNTISCASCHGVDSCFTDLTPVAVGINGQYGARNSPTIVNAAYARQLFWDGRAESLEEQAKGPLANVKEMALDDDVHKAYIQCQERINAIPGYRKLFKEVFGSEECNIDMISKAIATFERLILSGNSAFDQYLAGDKSAMTPDQIAGYDLFRRKGCAQCHIPPVFRSSGFANIGIGMDKPEPDLGRYNVTHRKSDWGSFKMPTLREVSKTAPYMHDGSMQTLEEVIDYYDRGGNPNPNLDRLMRPLHLSAEEKKQLISFMYALDGEGWQHMSAPKSFPQ
jgi:cytochrome c peroxidase